MKVKLYLTSSGRSPIDEFLQGCSAEIKNAFVDAVNLLAEGHILPMPYSKNLSSIFRGLHELRLKDGSGQFTFFTQLRKKLNGYQRKR